MKYFQQYVTKVKSIDFLISVYLASNKVEMM